MIFTEDDLELISACHDHVRLFKRLYPDGLEITIDNVLEAYKLGLDVDYVFMYLVDDYTGMDKDYQRVAGDLFVLLYSGSRHAFEMRRDRWDEVEPHLRANFSYYLPRAIEELLRMRSRHEQAA